MSVDLNCLVDLLCTVEEEPSFTPPEVSDYVLRHIYEPLLRGESVLFSTLDFDAFDPEDLLQLEYRIGEIERVFRRLANLSLVFCEAIPVSLRKKAFC